MLPGQPFECVADREGQLKCCCTLYDYTKTHNKPQRGERVSPQPRNGLHMCETYTIPEENQVDSAYKQNNTVTVQQKWQSKWQPKWQQKHWNKIPESDKENTSNQPNHRTCGENNGRLQHSANVSFNLLQVLKVALLLIVMDSLAVQGQGLGPHYKIRRICVSDDECNTDIGEVCWWAWDGCDTGQCMCDPRTTYHDTLLNLCRPLKYGDERCEVGDRCWEGMSCIDGYCQCNQGTMTSDKMFCLRDHEKFLGHTCSRYTDICYQRTLLGYSRKDTHCSHSGRCRCNRGYKEDGYACRKWNVNEPGCHEDYHCQGGALCIDKKCQCPSRYRTVARNSKCARIGAKYDLQLGEVCDEINERGYCAYGLVCHRCPSEVVHKCVRFMEAEALPYHYSSASHLQSSLLLIAITLVCTLKVFSR